MLVTDFFSGRYSPLFIRVATGQSLLHDVNGTVTGIMDIATDDSDTAPTYNMQGQRVKPNYRGIVIKNGEKRVVK